MKRRKYTKKLAKSIYFLLEYYSLKKLGEMLRMHSANIRKMLYRFGYIKTRMYRYRKFDYLKETEKAYIAGLIDGEGHIGKDFRICIANTNHEVLLWLKNKLGGAITKQKIYKKNHSPSWHWLLSTVPSRGLILSVLPYLIIKKERALTFVSDWNKLNYNYFQFHK